MRLNSNVLSFVLNIHDLYSSKDLSSDHSYLRLGSHRNHPPASNILSRSIPTLRLLCVRLTFIQDGNVYRRTTLTLGTYFVTSIFLAPPTHPFCWSFLRERLCLCPSAVFLKDNDEPGTHPFCKGSY